MIKKLSLKNISVIYDVINKAACAYQRVIPADCYHDPYMPKEELRHEMARMTFFGWDARHRIIGVVGFQSVKDVTLIRHAYVLPNYQRRGIGTKL
jgi:GNAT superfamily N-acetyltransferase